MRFVKFLALAIFAFSSTFFIGSPISAKKFVIRLATIAPQRTVFTRYIGKMKREMLRKSNGRLVLRVYAGGTAGTERTIVRKMGIGSVDMAALTGIGLGYILPKVRILDLPFMFDNTKQVDYVVKKLYPIFREDFRKKGYVLAGWNETGWVYLMAKKPISRFDDLKGLKIFAPKGDKMVKAMFQEFSVVPIYLSIESVVSQLETGGLDAIFAPPTGAIGLQWHRSLKYITNLRINNFTAANVVTERAYSKLPPDLQDLLVKTAEKYSRKLTSAVRKSNAKSLKVLKKRGLKMIAIDKKDLKRFKAKAILVRKKLVAKRMYTAEFLNTVNKFRAAAK